MVKRLFAVLAAAAWLSGVAHAQSNPLTVEDLYKPPAYGQVTASRDGKNLAVTVPSSTGRLNLAIVDLETRKGELLTSFRDFDVSIVGWVGNQNILFTVFQYNTPAEDQRGGGLFSLNLETKQVRTLTEPLKSLIDRNQFVYRGYDFLRTIPGTEDEILATGNMRDALSQDVYRLNVKTGRATLLTENRPNRTFDWVLDRARVPRVAVSRVKDSNTVIVHYRKDAESPLEEIYRYESTKPGLLDPLYFEADNQTLVVATNINRTNVAIHRYDPNARKLGALVFEHPRVDVGVNQRGIGAGGVVQDPLTDEVLGYTALAEKTEIVRLTESQKRRQAALDAALPNTVNNWQPVRGDLYLVTASSDRSPTAWYLFDEGKRTLEQLFISRPWLSGNRLVEMKPFYYKTRDGLEILSYYFLPPNRKPGERLPTVVHIHGGPQVRADIWGRDGFGIREAQLLASRGYAVILPNFRITPGLGDKVYYAGVGQFGRRMVDDHEDAAKWAIEQGIADPERICISGASYGGYATLMSLARFPKTFKCGISGLMVADVKLQLTSTAVDFVRSREFGEAAVQEWLNMIGVTSTSEIPSEISPVNLADRIKQPLFIYAGGSDQRTPMEQTRAMIRALERAGNPPKEVVFKGEESHGFAKLENNVDLYTKMLKFLDEQIGPGSRK
jgi:dipeptidyl aminopeptidase/acylaminoacyl peptidase